VMYGSDYPCWNPQSALQVLDEAGLSKTAQQKIMYDNAAKLLGLRPAMASMRADEPRVQDLVGEIVREVMARLGR